jgi:hypothetical protein
VHSLATLTRRPLAGPLACDRAHREAVRGKARARGPGGRRRPHGLAACVVMPVRRTSRASCARWRHSSLLSSAAAIYHRQLTAVTTPARGCCPFLSSCLILVLARHNNILNTLEDRSRWLMRTFGWWSPTESAVLVMQLVKGRTAEWQRGPRSSPGKVARIGPTPR